ncbi:MAG: hypothetical protein HYZ27_12435, partial [Deltaproteobacteria bacterium]|nr:hypothetical protein [Deltaproteobacteria bacterium]
DGTTRIDLHNVPFWNVLPPQGGGDAPLFAGTDISLASLSVTVSNQAGATLPAPTEWRKLPAIIDPPNPPPTGTPVCRKLYDVPSGSPVYECPPHALSATAYCPGCYVPESGCTAATCPAVMSSYCPCTECSTNADCPAGEACRGGACGACSLNSDCDASLTCGAGFCGASCSTSADCTGGERCLGGACQPCRESWQCPGGQVCVGGACENCDSDFQCAPYEVCGNGHCGLPCADVADCAGDACLDGVCRPCRTNSDCGLGNECAIGVCQMCADPGACVFAGVPQGFVPVPGILHPHSQEILPSALATDSGSTWRVQSSAWPMLLYPNTLTTCCGDNSLAVIIDIDEPHFRSSFWNVYPTTAGRPAATAPYPGTSYYMFVGGLFGASTLVSSVYRSAPTGWVQLASISPAVSRTSAALYRYNNVDGVIVVGGTFQGTTSTLWVRWYDPVANAWSNLPDLPAPTGLNVALVAVTGGPLAGSVVQAGGGERWDNISARANIMLANSGVWSPLSDLPVPLFGASGVETDDGKVIIAGGHRPVSGLTITQSNTDIFELDLATLEWDTLENSGAPVSSRTSELHLRRLEGSGRIFAYEHHGARAYISAAEENSFFEGFDNVPLGAFNSPRFVQILAPGNATRVVESGPFVTGSPRALELTLVGAGTNYIVAPNAGVPTAAMVQGTLRASIGAPTGMVVRWTDENNHVRVFMWNPDRLVIEEVIGGVATELQRTTVPGGLNPALGGPYHMRVRLDGEQIQVNLFGAYLNAVGPTLGSPELASLCARTQVLSGGGLGFYRVVASPPQPTHTFDSLYADWNFTLPQGTSSQMWSQATPGITMSPDNLVVSESVTSHETVIATNSAVSGKYYWEYVIEASHANRDELYFGITTDTTVVQNGDPLSRVNRSMRGDGARVYDG